MAARLTDRQKKKIIADYIAVGSYKAAGKMNGVSDQAVKRVIQSSPDFYQMAKRVEEQNTADIVAYMESQRDEACTFLGMAMQQLANQEKLEKTPILHIARAMAIVKDMYTTVNGGPGDTTEEDALSRSLKELGKELKSD